ncbi:MAG: hypothetical protein WDZ56_00715 [Candidatus Paceibacterota bacterium]
METHAHLLIAPSIESSDLAANLKNESVDTSHLVRSSFGIEDARELIQKSMSRGWEKNRRFVIFTENITDEAQNALLKLFEEPPENTIFYLIIPNSSILLPTLRSRLIASEGQKEAGGTPEATEFIKMPYGERLDLIAKLAKKDPDTLKRLVLELGKLNTANQNVKRSLLLATKYISNRGASKKMLAEELALALPGCWVAGLQGFTTRVLPKI